MTKIQTFFRDTTNILLAEFSRTKNIEHNVSKGNNREFFIENFIKKSFPSKFVIGTGEILDSEDNISKQADVVIYDEFMPVFDYSASQHFLSEGVLSHIEVKSNLTSTELITALGVTKTIKSLKKEIDSFMTIGELSKKVFSCIFSYDGIDKETFKKGVLEYYKTESDINNCVDIICVLNKYVMVKNFNQKSSTWELVFFETKEDSLMVFFTRLFDSMYKNWAGQPNINKYLGQLNYVIF
ncbi:hypothetical protein IT399_02230 [Candidatus Nomurabacteria bacterium]|nr:hypothetical protein [Candidatus Nomurabacteria bacterium]